MNTLTCPSCSYSGPTNEGWRWFERLPHYRNIKSVTGDVIHLSDHEYTNSEDDGDQGILCPSCFAEFDVPEGLTVEFT